MDIITRQAVAQSYFIANLDTLSPYDVIRWYRSRNGQAGPYEAATDIEAEPASLQGTHAGPHAVNGKSLNFQLDLDEYEVEFTDADPVSTDDVVAAINTAVGAPVAYNNDEYLAFSYGEGSASSIEILGGDAAPYLGLQADQQAIGLDAHTALDSETHEYFWTDSQGSSTWWYRAELYNTETEATAGLSPAFVSAPSTRVAYDQTVMAYIRLSDLSGKPIAGRRITVHNVFRPNTATDSTGTWGIFRHYAQVETDSSGYAEIRLLRGARVDFSVDGTGFIRRIEVPEDVDAVDLLDPDLVVEDEFGIAQPDIDFAVRTS